MKRVALTGNVASGKSEVARIWREAGVPVVSADDLSRQVTAPGSEGLAAVVEALGRDVLDSRGALDRDRVRNRVFKDPEARRTLEAVLHPRIRRVRDRWEARVQAGGAALAVSEIPLLFEAGLAEGFDVVVLVDAPEELRRERLEARPGVDAEEASRIMGAQMAAELKRERADFVLENDGTLEALEEQALALLRTLRDGGEA